MDGLFNFMVCLTKIRKVLRDGNFDVLNTHSRRDTLISGLAARLARTPLIVRTRHLANRPGSLLSYTIIPHRVTTVSDYVRRTLVERGVKPHQVATVYTPVQLAPVAESSTLRSELQLAPDDVIVGCVAVMRAQKGHRALIDAIEPLLKDRPQLHLVFVGGGSPVFEQVQSHIAKKGLQRQIHLLGVRQDVPNLLAGFDVFALATENEAMGTVFVEASGAGLAVVGTDVGGVSELIQDGVTGLLVPLHDQGALTSALEKLIDDPALRSKMGQAGQTLIRGQGRFTLDGLAESTETCYLRWLGELQT
jgi:glycosyltransferase involved in cell wall biosynthesis